MTENGPSLCEMAKLAPTSTPELLSYVIISDENMATVEIHYERRSG